MNAASFIEDVEKLNRATEDPVESQYLNAAICSAIKTGKAQGQGDVRSCLSLARRLQETMPRMAAAASPQWMLPADPASGIKAERLFDQLEERAEELRLELFGARAIPFPNWDDAVDWIRQQERSVGNSFTEQQIEDPYCRIAELCHELSLIIDSPVDPPAMYYRMLVYDPKSDEKSVNVARVLWSNKKLWSLNQFVEQASQETGLLAPLIPKFVLSGIRVPPATTVRTNPLPINRIPKTEITFYKTLPSWADFRAVYKFLRAGRDRRKGLSKTNKDLIRVIRSKGGVPSAGIMKFWKEVAVEVSRELERKLTGVAVRKQYRRFPKEIKDDLENVGQQSS